MMKDYFEIEFGLLRSRMKRVIQYINSLTRRSGKWVMDVDGIEIPDLKNIREGFEKAAMNYFDDEFKVSAGNGFQLIVDHNFEKGDMRRYNDNLDIDCF